MLDIRTQEIPIDEGLKKKLDIVLEFSSIKDAKFINGNFRKIELTNLTYIEPHRIIIESKNITLLAFNYYNEVYINNLAKRIKISKLTDYLKSL